MNRTLKFMIIFIAINAVCFYLIPLIIRDFTSAVLIMYIVNPVVVFGCAFFYGRNCGFQFLYVILVAVSFIPAIFVFYNVSASIYLLIYGITALLGLLLGSRFKIDHEVTNNSDQKT